LLPLLEQTYRGAFGLKVSYQLQA